MWNYSVGRMWGLFGHLVIFFKYCQKGSPTLLNLRAMLWVHGVIGESKGVIQKATSSQLTFGYILLLMILIHVKTMITLMSYYKDFKRLDKIEL